MSRESFRSKLQTLINCESQENGSDTPDFILAGFLCACLDAFDHAVSARSAWNTRRPSTPDGRMEEMRGWCVRAGAEAATQALEAEGRMPGTAAFQRGKREAFNEVAMLLGRAIARSPRADKGGG